MGRRNHYMANNKKGNYFCVVEKYITLHWKITMCALTTYWLSKRLKFQGATETDLTLHHGKCSEKVFAMKHLFSLYYKHQ